MNTSTPHTRIWAVLALALVLGVVLVPGAASAPKPLLVLGPITVLNGTANVSGVVSANAASTRVLVNGRPLALNAVGAFNGSIVLNGATKLSIVVRLLGNDEQTAFTIPLPGSILNLGGVIPAGVLDTIQQAGVSLLPPLRHGSGLITVAGSVLDRGKLVSLTLNGKDVLCLLQPSGAFSAQVPGTTKVITLTATDIRNTTQTITVPVPAAARQGTVGAAQAVGLRIARMHFVKRGVLRTHRIRFTVTVRDKQGRLVRGAKISVRSIRAHRLARRPRACTSGAKGTCTFVLRLRSAAYGKRLVVVTTARTPASKASRKAATLVPRRKAHRIARH